jgi:hypothetical protein
MRHCFGRQVFIAAMVIIAVGFGAFGQQRSARTSRQAVSANQNPAVAVQTNCVNAPAMPDIVLVGVAISGGPVSKPAPGATFQVTATIENRGQCETGPFKVQISVYAQDMTANKVEDKVVLTKMVQSMQPTRDKNPAYIYVTADYTLGPNFASTYDFYASADPENKVNEFIENNNALERGDAGQKGFLEVVKHGN